MATLSVHQQADQSWSWTLTDGRRRLVVQASPGYGSPIEAAGAAIEVLGQAYRHLAVRLVMSMESRQHR